MKLLLSLLTLSSALSAAGLSLSGVIISDNQKMITSRNMGFVTSVNVSEGSQVRKGDLLYTIDSREIDSAKTQVDMGIAQAELSLQMYQNQYENVKVNLERNRRLLAQDMVSRYEVENLELAEKNLKNTIKISERQVSQAKARQSEVTNQYQYLRIVAPNSGVVISKNIKVGEMAMPGMPAIVLSDLSTLKIEVEVAESNLKLAPVGKKVKITIPSMGYVGIGTVSSVIPSSNPMTHTFKVKVSFSAKQTVYPGMYATVELN
ncbi:MAG: efflux RND transporter periplasmic adaptor subunit [Sulfuricurvum sp.]|uniref:efflux RND transporter periplasmic adaptor subunit n=1 Tax=Sulfuricurvum sp. TaxID=2025608 RepID=UPI00261B2144|nr:efflux RND transporter periplasmic adaptor subunit [Sulfuricurvum sp.]MDD2828787.1 efflux RND transporter periplasmic adaptor subunit [Sulfuricurvum sp.]MDD4948754.1 efflux RND transporter periplasmic adaptor subunit [Sulfuricurvum sp.]